LGQDQVFIEDVLCESWTQIFPISCTRCWPVKTDAKLRRSTD